MKEKISSLMTEINGDYRRKTTLFSFFSALLNLFFTFFHAVFGVVSSSLLHGSISVYIENSKKGAMPSLWHMNCVQH